MFRLGVLLILILGLGGLFFFINPSYQNSFQARLEYMMDRYETAYELAHKAYKLDAYNKMAFDVLTKSKKALLYIEYTKRAKEYFAKINHISSKNNISQADKLKIKFMCEVAIGEYEELSKKHFDNDKLKNKAKEYYEKFKQIYKELWG